MATKTSIISEINQKIVTKGNILATDTNKILKDILNCDELNSNTSLQTFQFQGSSPSNNVANISYSIRGITSLFANITLNINVKESNTNIFTVAHGDKDLVAALSSIIKGKGDTLDFVVRITKQNTAGIYKKLLIVPSKIFRIGSLKFGFNNTSLIISVESQEPNDKLVSGDNISTSFAIHTP